MIVRPEFVAFQSTVLVPGSIVPPDRIQFPPTVTEDVPWRGEVVDTAHVVLREGRIVRPSGRPGLGVEVNEAAAARHPFQSESLQRVYYRDGSVGDW